MQLLDTNVQSHGLYIIAVCVVCICARVCIQVFVCVCAHACMHVRTWVHGWVGGCACVCMRV